MHSLRDCEFAADIWNKFVNEEEWSRFFSLGFSQWLEANLMCVDLARVNGNGLVSLLLYHT